MGPWQWVEIDVWRKHFNWLYCRNQYYPGLWHRLYFPTNIARPFGQFRFSVPRCCYRVKELLQMESNGVIIHLICYKNSLRIVQNKFGVRHYFFRG